MLGPVALRAPQPQSLPWRSCGRAWHARRMAESWERVTVDRLRVGDHVRLRDAEFDVARIDANFLGRASMVCLIEDTPTRWHAYPAGLTAEVERSA